MNAERTVLMLAFVILSRYTCSVVFFFLNGAHNYRTHIAPDVWGSWLSNQFSWLSASSMHRL